MAQKIETGGTSSTRTPMLKFRMKFALCDKEARHMTHCASVESEKSKTHRAAIIPSLKIRSTFIIIFCRPLKESVGKNSRVARNAYSSLASPSCSPLNQEQFPSISIFCLRHFLRQARKAASNESLVIPTRGGALRTCRSHPMRAARAGTPAGLFISPLRHLAAGRTVGSSIENYRGRTPTAGKYR